MTPPKQPRKKKLSPAELKYLAGHAQGLTSAQIGERYDVSEFTVKNTVRRARRFLQADNVVHAVTLAVYLRYLDVDVLFEGDEAV